MLNLDVTYDRKFPEFICKISQDSRLLRVYGAEVDHKHGVVRFPAYWPFHAMVVQDANTVFKNEVSYTGRAQEEYDAQVALCAGFVSSGGKLPASLLDTLPDNFFRQTPYEHQMQAIALGYATIRCGWLYGRGLGKTKIAIDLLRLFKLTRPQYRMLVITPPVTIPSWQNEIDFHSWGQITSAVYQGAKKDKALVSGADVILTTYETCRTHWKALSTLSFHRVIFDESHRLRNPQSAMTKAAFSIAENIPERTIMTGSSHWDPRHLYSQLKILTPALVPEGSFTKFGDKFLQRSPINQYVVTGFKNMHLLKQRINLCCLYRTPEECLDLPKRVTSNIYVDLTPELIRVYRQMAFIGESMIKDALVSAGNGMPIVTLNVLQQASRGWVNESNKNPEICDECEHMLSCVKHEVHPYTKKCKVVQTSPSPTIHDIELSPILDTAITMALDVLGEDSTNKIIMWFRSNTTLLKCYNLFNDRIANNNDFSLTDDVFAVDPALVLVGSSDYGHIVRSFQNDPDKRILFGQIKCGIGITLTAANYTFYPELTLNAEDMEQSIDRNYRIGQKRPVVVYRFIANETIDAGILALLEQKLNIQQAICDHNFCERCVTAGKCVLNLCDNPGTSNCGLRQFVKRSQLTIPKRIWRDEDAEMGE